MQHQPLPPPAAAMSHLRDIMQKLGQRHAASHTASHAVGAEPATDITPAGGAELEQHRRHYRQQLRACTPAMLRYEWTWLHQHLEDLELCRTTPEMLRVTGGRQHLDLLLAEARAYLEELKAEFAQRGLVPARESHSVLSAEHAWEVSNETIRSQWGFEAGAS
ncbi:MAG: hypothetical protein ACRC1L_15655 [Prochlorococcaceae cyanobacterium]